MAATLTDTQNRILDFVQDELRTSGRAPTMREIQTAFDYQSPHTAQFHVNNLIKAGCLRRGEGHRALQLVRPPGIPVIGIVAAGAPIEAIEEASEHLDLGGFDDDGHFALKVRGESMIEECIADGDHVVVRKQSTCRDGELVVARVSDEATLKRFYREDGTGRVRLQPANSHMEAIFCNPTDVTIEGVVVGVVRLIPPAQSLIVPAWRLRGPKRELFAQQVRQPARVSQRDGLPATRRPEWRPDIEPDGATRRLPADHERFARARTPRNTQLATPPSSSHEVSRHHCWPVARRLMEK